MPVNLIYAITVNITANLIPNISLKQTINFWVFFIYSDIAVQIGCHARENGHPEFFKSSRLDSRLRGNDIMMNSNLKILCPSSITVQFGHV